ncbi:tetratricopeptide repeat protein [Sinimarinibacterium sp. NLF-5-8]|uniref:tetratricopeptide repeat protein n=1 Tax=Sinimarinibacterium sp. NLF-5-8 TaxID=2698684 RepID=UPI00137C24D0|nr:sel1 repeat family protein [Sinimarinibacterium sp. NLF-5-8]QHS09915.1 sel1 repeat family protein [Sinimarinibacterium sp. NLF-5-8]
MSTAISVTGLSKRTLWRRIAEGVLRTECFSDGSAPQPSHQTRVALDDALTISLLSWGVDDRALMVQADAGLAQAQCDFALLLLGQAADVEAVVWLRRAAEQAHLDGMYWLGRCLIAGRGGAVDRHQGVDWVARAANHGHVIALAMVQVLYDPTGQMLDAAALDAALDGIERRVVVQALAEAARELRAVSS